MTREGRILGRRGAVTVEVAIILMVFLTLIFGMLDLAIAVFRHHVISEAVRMGARQAAVHGSLAPSNWNGGPWGPASFGPVAATSDDVKVAAITPYLGGMDPATVNVSMSWPDGKNTAESRVSVTISTSWSPIMGFIFGNSSQPMQATSVMLIAH